MEFGAHLPIVDLGEGFSLTGLKEYARAASELGYSILCANDHLAFARPWLDSLTALSAVIDQSGAMTLATTVSLPVIRGALPLAKALTAIDVLSGGRVLAGVGPVSSRADYALVGVPFEHRWRRFEESLTILRQVLGAGGDDAPGDGGAPRVDPPVSRPGGIPLWVASWGSPAGLRRVSRLGDGWIASAYNVTPDRFRDCLAALRRHSGGAAAHPPPNALATTWTYVADDPARAERMLTEVLAPMLGRPVDELRHLPIGTPELCAQNLTRLAAAGVERVLLWPLTDPVRQLQLVRERVIPLTAPPS